jgi:hypothetical protein
VTPEVIKLEYNSTVISLFLQLAAVQHPYFPPLSVRTAYYLDRLCKQLDTNERITTDVAVMLEAAMAKEPHELLIFACELDDVALARRALKLVKDDYGADRMDAASLKVFLGRLTSSWREELLCLSIRDRDYAVIAVDIAWSKIADVFDPKGEARQ